MQPQARQQKPAANHAIHAPPSAPLADVGDMTLAEMCPIGLLVFDASGRCVYANSRWAEMTGRDAVHVLERCWTQAIHDDDRAAVVSHWEHCRAAGQPFCSEHRYARPDGEVRWVLAEAKAAPPSSAGVRWLMSVTDITERHAAEEALRLSEERFRIAATLGTDLIYEWDLQTKAFEFFGAKERLLGPNPDKATLTQEAWEKAVHPDDLPGVLERGQALVEKGTPFDLEYRILHRGVWAHWINRAQVLRDETGRPYKWIGVCTDVTGLRQAEANSQRLLADLNERMKELTGLYRVSQVLQRDEADLARRLRSVAEALPEAWRCPDSAEAQVSYRDCCAATPGFTDTPWKQEAAFTTSDGAAGRVEVCYTSPQPHAHDGPFLLEEQYLLRSVAEMLRMHLDRDRMLQALQASEARFRTLVANLPGAVYRCEFDEHWTMSYISDAVERITGYRAEDFIGNRRVSFAGIIFPEDNAANTADVRDAVARRRPFQLEYRIRHADGRVRWMAEQGQGVFSDSGELMWLDGVVFDITELKLAGLVEAERNSLRQAVKAHERVLGVVAHELRTPLASTRAMTELLLSEDFDASQKREFLRSIHNETLRMAEMVNNLLEVARLNSGTARWNWGEVDVARVCSEALESVRPLIDPSRVRAAFDVLPNDMAMGGDADAIRRLLVNLLSNACKVTASGQITVQVTEAGECEGRWLRFVVADTGAGMSPETAKRLGEAFALNSGVVGDSHVRGTGLGLAICKGIVAAHGGWVSVVSHRGEGTTVTVMMRADLLEPSRDTRAGVIRTQVT